MKIVIETLRQASRYVFTFRFQTPDLYGRQSRRAEMA